MGEQPKWPDKSEIEAFLSDPESITKKIEFTFRFNSNYGSLPFAIAAEPNLEDLDDIVILLLFSIGIRVLSKRHGLGETLKKIEDIAYGRIDGKRVFKVGGCSFPKDQFNQPNEGF